MKKGDLIAFYPTKLFERIIARYDGKYCHIGICLGKNGGYQILSMTKDGLDIKPLDFYKNKYDIFRLSLEENEIKELIKFLLSNMPNLRYDFRGILSVIFPFIKQRSTRFYCSEFITFGLYYIGLLPDRLQLTPLDLTNQWFCNKIDSNKEKNET